MRTAVAIGTALTLLLGGCGGGRPEPLTPACSGSPESVLRALRSAPGAVRLADGTRLSDCVRRAFDDGELQQLGYALTPVADRLAARATAPAAVQLGYLVGAVRRGASRTNGIHGELVRRLEGTVTFDAPALLDAARRGAQAGETTG